MNSEIKVLLTGLLIGAGCMYGYLWKSSVLSRAYIQGQVEVMSKVCPPVVQAIAQRQVAEQAQPTATPRKPN